MPSAPSSPLSTLAFVESPVQLLNVLEWAYTDALRDTGAAAAGDSGTSGGSEAADGSGASGVAPDRLPPLGAALDLTVVVLSPHDPMTRGQLRRMAELARDEGLTVRWEDARGGAGAPLKTIGGLRGPLRRAGRIVIGDPFSRYVQLLLTLTRARDLVVVDDGTATMEFISQLANGERLVRWHRRGSSRGARDMVFAPVSATARRRLTPGDKRRVEVFSSMPVEPPPGVTVTANDFAWTRARFGPPRLTRGTDLVGTSLVETGVVDLERYLEAVAALARTHGATRYFAHRRESAEKLHRVSAEVGLEIVRPDLPLELIARRGPIGHTIVSFPSTVVHTLPLALVGTGVQVAVCDVDPAWLTSDASPRAQGFLSGVTGTARDVRRVSSVPPAPEPRTPPAPPPGRPVPPGRPAAPGTAVAAS
ncbi:hypothetical protein HUT19_24295 [Streptomyces sp. NA02950]|uniref:hypothetical protein n=1 Tax=Streptomyces sp. NA02950 TaxID=2742137 RepID=UPI0015918FE6|nr:hypothetical protein [Streptomyces sp. NA02950]QKV97789.1 hypothetical protein HUT19_24295 [Streptomyces sp. NA02950]